MKHMWKIAKWEIMRNLTNKQFIIGLLLTPLIMAPFAVVPVFLERWNRPSTSTYYVIDELGRRGSCRRCCLKTSYWRNQLKRGSLRGKK